MGVSEREPTLRDVLGAVGELRGELGEVRIGLGDVRGRLDRLGGEVTELRGDVVEQGRRQDRVDGRLNSLTREVETLSRELRESSPERRGSLPGFIPASANAACGFPALRFPVCFASRVMWPIRSGALSQWPATTGPGNRYRIVPAAHTATSYSTSSNRILDDCGHASGAAVSSSPPNRDHSQNTGSNARSRSSSPTLAGSD